MTKRKPNNLELFSDQNEQAPSTKISGAHKDGVRLNLKTSAEKPVYYKLSRADQLLVDQAIQKDIANCEEMGNVSPLAGLTEAEQHAIVLKTKTMAEIRRNLEAPGAGNGLAPRTTGAEVARQRRRRDTAASTEREVF